MEMSVSSEMTFFSMKLQPEICPQLRTETLVRLTNISQFIHSTPLGVHSKLRVFQESSF